MMTDSEELVLRVTPESDSDLEELDELVRDLRGHLRELDIDEIREPRAGEVPPGAKSADLVTTGVLVLTMAPALVSAVVAMVQAWLSNRKVRTIRVTRGEDSIELVDPSREDQRRLVEDFLAGPRRE